MSSPRESSDPGPAPEQASCLRLGRVMLDAIRQAAEGSDASGMLRRFVDSILSGMPEVTRVAALELLPGDGGMTPIAAAARSGVARFPETACVPSEAAAALAGGVPVVGRRSHARRGGWDMAPESRTALWIPIRLEGVTQAMLTIESGVEDAFADSDVPLLEAIAPYLADLLPRSLPRVAGERIRRVTEICRNVLGAGTLEDALTIAVRAVVEEYGIYCACVAFVTPDGRCLEHRAHHARVPVRIPIGYRQEITRGIMGRVAREKRTIRCDDVSREPDYVSVVAGVGSELCIPLMTGGRLVGLLDLNARRAGAFTPEDVGLMETLAGHLALVMEKARYLEQVEQTRDYLENLLAGAGDGIATLDRDGRFTRWNRGMQRLLGHDAARMIGAHHAGLGLRGSGLDLQTVVSRALAGETVAGMEARCVSTDGRPIDVALTLSPIMGPDGAAAGVSMIVRDVTERNRMERSLRSMHRQIREAEEKFLGMIERARDAIFFVEPGSGTIVQANARAEAMTGRGRAELTGGSVLDLHPAEERDRARAHLERTPGAIAEPAIELRLDCSADTPLDVEVSASMMSYGGRQLVQWLCRDISDRRRAEKEKDALHTQLVQSEKLSAIGQLISGVAHELNNPLTGVIGYSQLLASQDCDEKIRRGLDKVYAEAKRCHRVVQNLLTFARRHAPEKTWIGVNDIIESVIDLRAYQLRVDNIEIRRNLSKDIPLTMGDFHQLQQVFMNIIINAHQAFKISQKGSAITLTTGVVDGCIRVTIADDGPGIPEKNIQRVFDPFFTTKEPGQGTGLGLSLCYGIVEEHEGRIRVDSEPERGTTFTIDLPIIVPASAAGAGRDASRTGPGRAG